MKKLGWQFKLGAALVVLSAALYGVHYLIFNDSHHIFLYLVGDIAFVPMEVLLVTLIIHNLLAHREKKAMLQKLNMVIGAFFSEVGVGLLQKLEAFIPERDALSGLLRITPQWTPADFRKAAAGLKTAAVKVDSRGGDLAALREYLVSRRDFLLRLLENPNLLEHEAVTDLLWAVFHLTEELGARDALNGLPDSDSEHLSGDIKRIHGLLVCEWLAYMEHLKKDYPYLYSLAVRTNPFNPEAEVTVK